MSTLDTEPTILELSAAKRLILELTELAKYGTNFAISRVQINGEPYNLKFIWYRKPGFYKCHVTHAEISSIKELILTYGDWPDLLATLKNIGRNGDELAMGRDLLLRNLFTRAMSEE